MKPNSLRKHTPKKENHQMLTRILENNLGCRVRKYNINASKNRSLPLPTMEMDIQQVETIQKI
jgi:hypothetical protein